MIHISLKPIVVILLVAVCFGTPIAAWKVSNIVHHNQDLEFTIKQQQRTIRELREMHEFIPALEHILPSISQDEMRLLSEKLRQKKEKQGP